MLFNSYNHEISSNIPTRRYVSLLLVTVNNRFKFEMEIVHDLSCHPILSLRVMYVCC